MNCMEKMRTALLTLGSLFLTLTVVGNAYYQKKHFYPSAVYITKSNPSMAVLYIQAFILVILMGKLMSKLFFGSLRASEFEHLIERFWYAVTETCLAFTVFRDDFSPKFVALFTLLLFLKAFHWLAEDRVDFMERSPVITFLFHLRVVWLLATLAAIDSLFVNHAYSSTISKGPSVQLVFGFEYAILLMVAANIAMKYSLHTIDLNSQNPWENKAVFLLYTEVFVGFFKVLLYIAFVVIMVRIHTFPLFAIRPMYLTLRGFKKALHDVIMSRRAIRNMNTLYENATDQDLANTDNVCIICREEMNGGGSAKKLPCGHIFHSSCLRSWFQRQQTCPTCRMDVLRTAAQPAANQQPQQQAQQPQQAQQQAQPPPMPNFQPGNLFAGLFGQMPQMPAPPPQPSSSGTTQPSSGTAAPAPGAVPPMPPFPFIPFMVPPPMPPANLVELSDEELREMEGQERRNVEARIQCLRNIQTLLDAAMLHMNQYSAIVSTLNTPNNNTSPAASSKEKTTESKTESTSPPADESKKEENLEGAVGYSDERDEVRRRRLERFTHPDVTN